jgi:drug/metabolite transporter (DMT)-like permease
MKSLNRVQADIILFIVAVLWGTTFVASKIVLASLSPMMIIAMRFILALCFMMLIFRKELSKITLEDAKGGFIVGLMLFVAFYTQLFALKFTDPGKQAFLAGTYVIFVPFMMWIISKEKPDNRSFVGVFLCFIGISLLTLNSSFSVSFGDSLTLLSSVFFAGHIISTSYYVKRSTPIKITIVQFATVAILSSVSVLVIGDMPNELEIGVMLPILYLGVVCTGIAYFLQTYAQKFAKSTHTAIILSLEAVFGSLLSIIIVHEVFTIQMIIGSFIILTSILVVELRGNDEKNDEKIRKKCIQEN